MEPVSVSDGRDKSDASSSVSTDKLNEIRSDLPPGYVPHIELEFCHFLFLNADTPLVPEGDNFS